MIRRLSTVIQRAMLWLSMSLPVRDLSNTGEFWIDFGSIFAVSGVGGHAYGSWKSPIDESQMWLRDFLPKRLPKVRTFTFGYEAKLVDSTSDSSLSEYSKQLLLSIQSARDDSDTVSSSCFLNDCVY
jgi:hypothetical protein